VVPYDLSSLPHFLTPAYNPNVPELVECHSGYAYGERPIALQWEGERLAIEEIEASWRTPDGRRFQARVEDGRVFDLSYVEFDDTWQIVLA
jgi:hypothetical protein